MGEPKPPFIPNVFLAPRDDYKEFECEAALAYARAINRLDIQPLAHLLSENCIYESQHVREPLRGKEAILAYFQQKFRTIQEGSSDSQVFAELGKMIEIYVDRPCVIVAQGVYDNRKGVVLFEVSRGKIDRIDMCGVLPNPTHAQGTGEYPV